MKVGTTCQECGLVLNDVAEYHPLTFCRMVQAGINPWQFLADTLWRRGWEDESVKILRRFTVRDMNMRARPEPPRRRAARHLVGEARS